MWYQIVDSVKDICYSDFNWVFVQKFEQSWNLLIKGEEWGISALKLQNSFSFTLFFHFFTNSKISFCMDSRTKA